MQKAYLDEVREIYRNAESAGRELTPSERGDLKGLLENAESHKRVEDRLKGLGGGGDWSPAGSN